MRVDKPRGKKLFSEEQQFRQWWLWLLFGGTLLSVIIGNIISPPSPHMMKTGEGIAAILVGTGIPMLLMLFLYITRFETTVTDEGVYFRWWPFQKKFTEIKWDEVIEASAREKLITGLGVKYQIGFGWNHQVSGQKGVELTLRNRKLWIGTCKPERFVEAIREARPEVLR
ncbi:hypothetical protein HHL16_20600 [Pseudoflavitalea sp. G-6-1-2]|uniref:hypothetical protein n=1 Tax=Pseudoflavitalea sp. G-6-1-2 TaxID=2728841 RepID=UPI00146A4577|nr:hypothetical protein [Pseudoflavitalea sp. G-6-1-2]NML23291.1 hypothetical protein [Pseudoflavitalea sp. G-6-1-2]